ncbi:MAG TPA: efflux RND transporter periplasmic adaptor subunit [Chthonomonadaceae bacterium]|nr:efflux RND transporter periplasmic adaptor subunit [Chthonomonadaceae bacterium]
MAKKLFIGCGLSFVLMALLVWVGVRALLKPKPKVERAETVQRGDVEIKVVETGTIEPLRKVEVKSKVGGRISRLFVDEGMRVRQGQILATIDPQEINSQVAALRAQLAGAQARLAAARKNATYQQDQTTTSIAQYEHNVEAALARLKQAEAEAEAQPRLTQQSIDIAQANLDAARASLRAQQESLNLMVQSTHPQAVVAAQSAYDQARVQADNDARNLQRQQQLFANGFVSQQAVDAALTQAQVSEAHMREVKARLDRMKRTNDLEAANARAQVASAQGQVRQMQAALAQARTSVLNTTRRQELESARAAYAQARAQLAAARTGRTQDLMRRDDIAAAASEVQQIQNQLNERLVNQRDTTLVAAMTGLVTKRYVEQGELITSAISSFSSGTPVFQIADLSTMLVKININEVDIAKLRRGLLTEVSIDASRGATFTGRVRKVAPAAMSAAASSDSSSANTANTQTVIRFPVEIQIDRADSRLKPGMSARCAVIVARRRNVLRVPTNCVQGEGATATVQVVTETTQNGEKVETTTPRQVTIGLRGDDFVEIVSGLKEGEKVRPAPYTGPPRKTIEMRGGPGGGG